MNNRSFAAHRLHMDRFRRIELLVRAADAGSFASAARSLDLTPSAVSHSIAELERELHTTLFYRTTRQLRLTAAGEDFCRRGREILEKLSEAEAAASRGETRLAGMLRVGMPTAISRHIVMPSIAEFMRRQPHLKVECRLAREVQEMHAGGLDFLLRVGEPPDSELVARKVAQIKYGLYAAPAYLKRCDEPCTPDDLKGHRCLVFKPNWATKPLDQWTFEQDGRRRTVGVQAALSTDDREGLIATALAGGGIMRAGMFDPATIATGQLKRLLGAWKCADAPAVYLLYRKGARSGRKLAAFVEFIEHAFAAFDPQELTLLHV
jgi:LysR family transcriptional regulator, regulator for bpeEF and oprC